MLSYNTCSSSSHSCYKSVSQNIYDAFGFANALWIVSFIWYFQYVKMEICLQTNNTVGWKILEVLCQPKARSYLKVQMPALTVRCWFWTSAGLQENIHATALVFSVCASVLAWNMVVEIMWHWNTEIGTHAWMQQMQGIRC